VTVSAAGVVHSVGPEGGAVVTVSCETVTGTVGVFVGTAPPGTVLATVQVPGAWGVTAAAGKLYVTAVEAVRVGALPTFAFPQAIPVVGRPLSIAVNGAGTLGYVTTGVDAPAGEITILDLTSNTVQGAIASTFGTPLSAALSPNGGSLFVGTDNGLMVIDVASKTVVSTFAVGSINQLTPHPTLPRIYATVAGGTILEIDAVTRSILRSLPVPGAVQGTAVSPDGTELYVAQEFGGDLVVWDLATNQLKQSVPGAGGFGLALSPDGKSLYVVSGGEVYIVDRVSRARLRTVNISGNGRRIAFDPATGIAAVTNEAGWVDFLQ
jgi:DNA-binding beta-propeller fold protein YncE